MRTFCRILGLGAGLAITAAATLSAQPNTDAQGDVGIGTRAPHASALLDLTSTIKGFLMPRMTTAQRDAIGSPANGLMVYNTDDGFPQIWSDASGSFKWDSILTTGSNAGWLTRGNTGLINGTNNFFGTTDNIPVRIITNNTERMRIEGDGDFGINETSPSAKLDVVATAGAPAIEANTSAGTAIYTQSGGAVLPPGGTNWGVFASVTGGSGNVALAGIAGSAAPINNNTAVAGANDAGHGVAGNSVATGFAGVFGNATSTINPAYGVLGRSNGGTSGRFENTTAANASPTLQVESNGTGDGLEINLTGGGAGIDLNGGELDGNDRGNALGDGTANQQLTVRGTADAIVGNTLAGNPTVWDLVVQGDAVTTGLFKVGGSMWFDGISIPHQISANNPMNITTTSGNITINSAGGTTTVDDDLVVTGDLQLSGPLTLSGFTEGSVAFIGPSSVLAEDNTNFFWNNTSNQLGLGTNSTAARLHVVESAATGAIQATNSGSGNGIDVDLTNAGSTSTGVDVDHAGIGNGISVNLSNASNGARGIDVTQAGVGPGVFATSAGGNAVWGITSSISAAGVIGDNTFGEAVVGRNRGGNGVGAVVGRNDSSGYGVRGFNTKDGIGVLGQAGISGGTGTAGRFENVNAANTNTTLAVATNGIGGGIEVDLPNASNGSRGIDVTQAGVGPGVFATSAGGNAVWGITSSISAAGVIGDNTFGEAVVGRNRGGNGVGAVVGRNDSSGYGVRGFNTKDGIGVLGQAGISGGTGTAGRFENVNAANTSSALAVATNGIGTGIEVDLPNASNGARGIDVNQAGVGPGVFATSAGGNAVWGITSSISAAGVIGDNTFGEAVVGRNRGGNGVGAVVGRNDSSGYGVRGFNTKNGYGVLGQAGISGGTGTAGRFENVNAANTSDALQVVTNSSGNAARFTGNVVVNGNLTVSGTVAKGGGSFMIDHPLDPENKILYHSFVESPDMKNINDGVAMLDAKGEAWVELPDWFMALNGDFRYQLTAIGAPGPNLYIAEEIKDNRFKIAGGKPGTKVSWMVTGIRHDAYAQKHRIQVEVDKSPEQRGQYLHPDSFGVPASKDATMSVMPELRTNAQQLPSSSTNAQPEVKAPTTTTTSISVQPVRDLQSGQETTSGVQMELKQR